MAKIIAVSGTQCSGKSTTLNILSERGYHVDDFKVARSVMKTLGTSIDQFRKSESQTIEYQEEVLKQKIERDTYLKSLEDDVILVERSFVDIYAYAAAWSFSTPSYYDWLGDYYARLTEAQQRLYSGIIVIPQPTFDHVDDGVRGDQKSQRFVAQMINNQLEQINPDSHVFLKSSDREQRADECQSFIKEIVCNTEN